MSAPLRKRRRAQSTRIYMMAASNGVWPKDVAVSTTAPPSCAQVALLDTTGVREARAGYERFQRCHRERSDVVVRLVLHAFQMSTDFFAGVDLLALFRPAGENLSSRVRSQSRSIDARLGAPISERGPQMLLSI